MADRPILFSAPMVRAILAGKKTVTRRVVKPQPEPSPYGGHWWPSDAARSMVETKEMGCMSPYGFKGDRLWVRETHCPRYFDDGKPGYRADWTAAAADVCPEPKWKPSIFMRRHDSRITLDVLDVRVERLQSITGADILAEGAVERAHEDQNLGKCPVSSFDGKMYVDLQSLWRAGWDAINGKRAPWSENPWVWVVDFDTAWHVEMAAQRQRPDQ